MCPYGRPPTARRRFSNTASIAIPGTNGTGVRPASPYPSTIAVSGMAGAVTKVRVTFNRLSHGGLGDVDAMVVAPDGTSNLVLLSDVGDPDQLVTISDQTLTFDDTADSVVPAQLTVTSGTYRPTNTNAGGATDTFPASAPTPSSQTTLAGAFTGLSSANGTWSLYVVDDVLDETGTMAGGWSIEITTAMDGRYHHDDRDDVPMPHPPPASRSPSPPTVRTGGASGERRALSSSSTRPLAPASGLRSAERLRASPAIRPSALDGGDT